MFCENCGVPMIESAKFCENCGTRMPIASAPTTPQPTQKKPLYKRWWFWLIVLLAVGIIGNIAQLLGRQGNNSISSTGNAVLSGSASRSKTATSVNRQQVSQQQVETALSLYKSVTILSHDVDSMIDSVSYKGIAHYKYMIMETTGIIAFEYNPNSNEWQRYPAGDSVVSIEQKWDLNGTWVFIEERNGRYIEFEMKISDIHYEEEYADIYNKIVYSKGARNYVSAEKCLANIYLDDCLYNEFSFLESGEFTLFTAGTKIDVTNRRWLDLDENPDYLSEHYNVYFDKEEGVLLSVMWPTLGNGYKLFPCERANP
ncbi:MAG: zinc-ribbon domain-containing protein [Oscillospiraceae bacterium]|jgi:hypothetical protein|nr:zinc-ribbon domain-containing protein [Oscillospiraceae bacterium]